MGISYINVDVRTDGLYRPGIVNWGNIGIVGEGTGGSASANRAYLIQNPDTAATYFGNGSDLHNSIVDMFSQEPKIKNVYAVMTEGATDQNFKDGIDALDSVDVQIVCLSNKTVTTANSGAGSLFKYFRDKIISRSAADRRRVGIVAFPSGAEPADMGTVRTNLGTERIYPVAHKNPSDNSAAAAAVIGALEPHRSATMRSINVSQDPNWDYTDDELVTIYDTHHVNPISKPIHHSGGVVLAKNFTWDSSGTREFLDIVRQIDYVVLKLKTKLTSPNVVALFRMDYDGMLALNTTIGGVLGAEKAKKRLDNYRIYNRLLDLLGRSLTSEEEEERDDIILSRVPEVLVDIVYRGALEAVNITLNFVPS